jgi:hypothetical protein
VLSGDIPELNDDPIGALSPNDGLCPVVTYVFLGVYGAFLGRWTFDADPVGGLPAGAQTFAGQWAVRAESDAPSQPNALCQTGIAEYPALSLDSKPYADLTLVARFKPISGQTDRAAGLIFRVQDKDNYYILRANALENNVNFYIYRAGIRNTLKGGNSPVASGAWQELRVEVQGNQFRGFLNGQQVADVTDDACKTGGIGLWTKADSLTCFDSVEVTTRSNVVASGMREGWLVDLTDDQRA